MRIIIVSVLALLSGGSSALALSCGELERINDAFNKQIAIAVDNEVKSPTWCRAHLEETKLRQKMVAYRSFVKSCDSSLQRDVAFETRPQRINRKLGLYDRWCK